MEPAAVSPAQLAPRQLQPGIRCGVVDFSWLDEKAKAWDSLVAQAATPNPFYSRRVVAAHVAHGLSGSCLRFAVVYRGDSLLALAPFQTRGAAAGFWGRAHAGWISPYIVTSTPLVSRQDVPQHVEALLDALREADRVWLLPLLSLESRVGAALQTAISTRGWPSETISAFGRAVLHGGDDAAYEARVGASRRKDFVRRRRRLTELGRVDVRSFTHGEDLARAVEQFLTLEMQGWKGAAGTALGSRPETAAFLRAAFAPAGGPVTCRADVLSLDDRAIAVSLAFVSGGTAYLFKTAYDETLRRHAPGVLLEDEIVRIRRETGFADCLNSASMPGGVLEGLYPGRELTGDLLFATDAAVSARTLASWAKQELFRRQATQRLKAFYRACRARCQPTFAKGRASVEAK